MTIKVPVAPQTDCLMLTERQDNPLAHITKYTDHVIEKMCDPHDAYHNFSPQVEQELGCFAHSEVIKKPTKQHTATIKYRIPALINVFGGKPKTSGEFEWVVQDGEIKHRMFKPEKKEKKEKLLSLPAPSGHGDNSKSLSQ